MCRPEICMGLGFCASLNRLCKVMFQMVFVQAKLLVFGLFWLLIAGTESERFFARMGLSVWPGAGNADRAVCMDGKPPSPCRFMHVVCISLPALLKQFAAMADSCT